MRVKDRYREVRDSIKLNLYMRHVSTSFVIRFIPFIIGRYFDYARKALVNGYPIKIVNTISIELEQEPSRNLEESEKGRYFKSNRVFGKMFSITMKGPHMNQNYLFYPDKKFSEPLQKSLDSDIIYELIKE